MKKYNDTIGNRTLYTAIQTQISVGSRLPVGTSTFTDMYSYKTENESCPKHE